mmetsp:Transcript_47371/g.141375  ORF Transcript_47371/g.141375 Transcript_47371/m.141375 type:complete len:218 (+) Transcript_47371:327-980(+)
MTALSRASSILTARLHTDSSCGHGKSRRSLRSHRRQRPRRPPQGRRGPERRMQRRLSSRRAARSSPRLLRKTLECQRQWRLPRHLGCLLSCQPRRRPKWLHRPRLLSRRRRLSCSRGPSCRRQPCPRRQVSHRRRPSRRRLVPSYQWSLRGCLRLVQAWECPSTRVPKCSTTWLKPLKSTTTRPFASCCPRPTVLASPWRSLRTRTESLTLGFSSRC